MSREVEQLFKIASYWFRRPPAFVFCLYSVVTGFRDNTFKSLSSIRVIDFAVDYARLHDCFLAVYSTYRYFEFWYLSAAKSFHQIWYTVISDKIIMML